MRIPQCANARALPAERPGGNELGTFREHSGNIQGTFRELSGNFQGTFREHSGSMKEGDIQGT
jgi:hypothetical protein